MQQIKGILPVFVYSIDHMCMKYTSMVVFLHAPCLFSVILHAGPSLLENNFCWKTSPRFSCWWLKIRN